MTLVYPILSSLYVKSLHNNNTFLVLKKILMAYN